MMSRTGHSQPIQGFLPDACQLFEEPLDSGGAFLGKIEIRRSVLGSCRYAPTPDELPNRAHQGGRKVRGSFLLAKMRQKWDSQP